MDRKQVQVSPQIETETIYVALKNIHVGDTITADLVELQEWPSDKIQPGAIRDIEEVLGHRPRTQIYQGDPILAAKLISADAPDTPTEQIPAGYRVFAVRVAEDTGTAGLARPGDRVDVQLYVTRDARKGIHETRVKTILEDVRVFAVDQIFRRGAEHDEASVVARTISLVVTPKQSAKLNLAAETGRIRLVLRHPDDHQAAPDQPITLDDLLNKSIGDPEKERASVASENKEESSGGIQAFLKGMTPAPESTPAAEPWVMAVLEGTNVREVEFQEDGRIPVEAAGASVEEAVGPQLSTPGLENKDQPALPEELGEKLEEAMKIEKAE